MRIAPEVADALAGGRPVVALESTLIAHGLPRPRNLSVAHELEAAVRADGAVPATIAVVARARPASGWTRRRWSSSRRATASPSAACATSPSWRRAAVTGRRPWRRPPGWRHRAGIQLFATGGLGGVHRGARETWDESADLETLARVGIAVVCSGVKSILDVAATLERLETLGVTVLGYGTDRFPGFYLHDSGEPVPWRVDTPEEVAAVLAARRSLGTEGRAVVVANPLPVDEQLDPELHDRVVEAALGGRGGTGVSGKEITPFLLDYLQRETGGASLEANVRLVLRNASLAARIAGAT